MVADVASFGTFAVYTVLFVSVVTVVVIFENVVSLSVFIAATAESQPNQEQFVTSR